MNPANQVDHPSNIAQDAASPPAGNNTDLIQAEIEHNIPVRQQDKAGDEAAVSSHNPITHIKQFLEPDADKKDDPQLDNLLQDVNRSVKDETKKPEDKIKSASQQNVDQKKETPKSPKNPKPIAAVTVAVVIACALSVTAWGAYSQNNKASIQVSSKASSVTANVASTSNTTQAVQNPIIKPADLSDLASAIQSKENSLNDDQDYNQTDLSDKNLGL
jgi:hypothetical protein